MTISRDHLHQAIDELRPLAGAQLQKITQSSVRELCLQFRLPGKTLHFLLSLEPNQEYVCLSPVRPPSLPQPPAFCMLLRKHLLHARWKIIEATPQDRIFCLVLLRAGKEYHLVVELIPRHGRWYLCDSHHTILSAHPTAPHALKPGDIYPYESFSPTHLSVEPEDDQHKHSFPPPEDTVIAPEGSAIMPNDSATMKVSAEDLYESESDNVTKEFAEDSLDDVGAAWIFPTHDMLYQTHVVAGEEQRLVQQRQQLLRQKKAQIKKAQRLLEHLEQDWQRCEQTLQQEQDAELLKSQIHQVQRGQSEVEVIDYYDPSLSSRVIRLDPAMSPQEYLNKLFHRIKRARRGIAVITQRIEQTEQEIQRHQQESETLQQLQTREDLMVWFPQENKRDSQTLASSASSRTNRSCYREYTALDGKPIWVGRTQKDNDELTLRVAKSHDLWLHVRGWAGSHVIIPLLRDESPSADRLIDAATLAAHFSQAREHTHADVMYTQIKYVKKPKGFLPGQVSVVQERNIALRREPERLHRLLQTEIQQTEN